jgi:sodium transport system permease protein
VIARLARVVLVKELTDGLRDRRSISMALLFPLLGPLVLAGSLALLGKDLQAAAEGPLQLPVAGREHAPALVAFLAEGGLEPADAPAEPERAVRAGQADFVLVLGPDFGARLREGRPAPVRLIVDASRRAAKVGADRVRGRLEQWRRLTATQRLILRGVHPGVIEPLAVEEVDVSTAESRGALLFSVLPYFLVLAVFMGGMAVAIDATAGERERQSLEPLLANPVPHASLVLGKLGAASTFALLALTETLLGFSILPRLDAIQALGLPIRLDPGVLLRLFLLSLPLLLAANAFVVLVAARARTFRAAQSTMSLFVLVPAVPGMILAMTPLQERLWMKLVPALAEQLLMMRLLRGEVVPAADWAMASGASLVLAAVLAALAARFVGGGRMLFDEA